jgi:hypothetical protein
MIGDGERITVLAVAQQKLAFVVPTRAASARKRISVYIHFHPFFYQQVWPFYFCSALPAVVTGLELHRDIRGLNGLAQRALQTSRTHCQDQRKYRGFGLCLVECSLNGRD